VERNDVNLVLDSLRSLVKIPAIECCRSQHKGPEREDCDFITPRCRISLSTKIVHVLFVSTLKNFSPNSQPLVFQVTCQSYQSHTSDFRKVTITFLFIHPRLNHHPSRFDSRPNQSPIIQTRIYLKWHLPPHFWRCTRQFGAQSFSISKTSQMPFLRLQIVH